MPTLAPRTDFQVAVENPVSEPSSLQALAGLVDAGLQVVGKIKGDKKQNLEQGLVNGLDAAAQLREQGDEAGARNLERTVMTNYSTAGGNLESGQTQGLIRAYTGRNPETVGFSPEEMLAQEISDPDSELGKAYNRNLLAAKGMSPDADDEAHHELAMSLIVKEQANAALIEEAKFNWSESSRGAILDTISNFGNISLGALNAVAQDGGTVKLEDIQAVRASFNTLKTQIQAGRPANVGADEWGTITNALAAREEQIKYLETLAGPGNLDARASAELMRAVQDAGINSFDANIATRLIADDPSIFLTRNIRGQTPFNRSLTEVFKYMEEPEGGGLTEADIRTPGTLDESVITGSDGTPIPQGEGLKYAQASSDVLSLIATEQLSNPAVRNEWGRAAVRQLSAIQGITEQGGYLSANDTAKMFGNKWMSDMKTLQNTDPALYNSMLAKTNRVLGAQINVLGAKFDNVAKGSPFEFNVTTGEFRFNPETARRIMEPKMADALEAAVDRHYGGDWDAVMADNGDRFVMNDERAATSAWMRVAGVRGAVPEDIRQMGNAYASVNRTLQGLNQFELAGQTTSSFSSDTPILQMMDKSEGGGAYDTLFSFAQRKDSPFAGMNITSMSIGQLKEFSSQNGKYGHWVKEELRKAGKKPVFATPMGRYQFVGKTLRGIAERMGLGDDVLFTPAVQDAMFHFHMNELLEGKDTNKWAGILRGTWDGFNRKDESGNFTYSDQELVAAASEFLGTPPPAVAYETARGDRVSAGTPESTEAPQGRPVELETTAEVQGGDPAELDQTTTSEEVEEGDASKQVAEDSKAEVIAELMEKWGLNERDATRLYEKSRAGL